MTPAIASIVSTIVACFKCSMTDDKIIAKLEAKYGLDPFKAQALVAALRAVA